MKVRLANLGDAFNRMSVRERGLITLALTALCYFACDLLLVQPELERQVQLDTRLSTQQTDNQQLQREIAQLGAALARDDEEQLRARAREDKPATAAPFAASVPYLPRLSELVREVLEPALGLRLLSLRTLPPRPVSTVEARAGKSVQADKSAPPPELPVHLHGLELKVAGPYLNLLPYLQRLQGFSEPLLWGDLYLNVATHPEVELRLSVSTLSEQLRTALGG